jgi:hypothetical protein
MATMLGTRPLAQSTIDKKPIEVTAEISEKPLAAIVRGKGCGEAM